MTKTSTNFVQRRNHRCFKLESVACAVCAHAKPSAFTDITAMVALYRPGPMDLIQDFIEGKHFPVKLYIPMNARPVLKGPTAFWSIKSKRYKSPMFWLGTRGSRYLRRAIGKEKEIMDKQKAGFVNRTIKQGYTKEIAEKVWSYIEKFAGYGFNKAHAASYAMIAYQTAYASKVPRGYMTAMLSIEANSHGASTDEDTTGVQECKRMKIVTTPPN